MPSQKDELYAIFGQCFDKASLIQLLAGKRCFKRWFDHRLDFQGKDFQDLQP